MGAFFKFLILFFAFYLLIRLVLRVLLPGLFRTAFRHTASSFNTHQQRPPRNKPPHSRKQEGEIRVEYIPEDQQKQNGARAGEFVDFEEVKKK